MSSSFFDYLAKYSYSIFITLNINLKLKQKIQSAWGNKGLKKQKRHFRGSWLSIYLTLWHAKTNSVSKFQTSANYGCLEKWDRKFFFEQTDREKDGQTDIQTHQGKTVYPPVLRSGGMKTKYRIFGVFFRVSQNLRIWGKRGLKRDPENREKNSPRKGYTVFCWVISLLSYMTNSSYTASDKKVIINVHITIN